MEYDIYRRVSSQLEVTVGSTSLTSTEPTEQRLSVFRIYNFDPPYNNVTKLHDIALLEVFIYNYKRCTVCK